jgi:CO/xanthine dehydrogenase FAD-binding subunit
MKAATRSPPLAKSSAATYRSSCEIHAPLETHGSVARWEGDRLTVWDTNQGPFGIQSGIAKALNMPWSKVRVVSSYMGGGFGSKQEAGRYSVIAALLAQKTARPVKLFLTREEPFLCVGNRASHIMTLKAGVKKDGTLTALQLTGLGEVGAYPSNTSGVGVAAGMFGEQFGPPANAIVCLNADGSVDLGIGAADLGTGTKTVMATVVAEELGVPLDRISVENADTGTTPYSRVSGGSKTVFGDSPAVRLAALEVKARLLEMAAEDLKLPLSDLVFKDGAVLSKGGKKLTLADLVAPRTRQMVVGVGRRDPDLTGKIVRPFAAHFAEVEVNTRTGEMRVVRMLAAQDSGRVMNLLTYRNQVQGGVLMGVGFAAMERRILDSTTGKMVNANLHDYKIPTAKDVPGEVTVLPIDPHDTECNLTGAKGLGEPSTIPAGAAIANAFYHATGIRITAAPITAAQILAGGTDLLGCLRDGVFQAGRLLSINGIKDLTGIRPRCWYSRGDFHCLRKGSDQCFAAAGQNQLHCIFGGYECFMVHPSDTAPALVALDAKVTVTGRRVTRQMPLASFFVLPKTSLVKENVLEPGDVLTEVLLDAPPSGAAIVLSMAEGKVQTARLALSGVAPTPWRSPEAEQALVGKPLDAATAEAAAAAAVKPAVPLRENAYKAALVRGMLEETLIALAV